MTWNVDSGSMIVITHGCYLRYLYPLHVRRPHELTCLLYTQGTRQGKEAGVILIVKVATTD